MVTTVKIIKIMKIFLVVIGICLQSAWVHALTVTVDTMDDSRTFTALKDTSSITYFERCKRKQFKIYEWKTWEGYYSARAYIMAIAVIKVKRDPDEIFGGDLTPFIDLAQEETGKVGGNAFCFVRIKMNKALQEPEEVIFRAYKQLFQAGNVAWENFFKDIMDQGILLTLEDIRTGNKTKAILDSQPTYDRRKK